jgi:hypothetical protein
VIRWQETSVAVKKKTLYFCLLEWMPCCFSCSVDMLVFHTCSNQKPFYKLKNRW